MSNDDDSAPPKVQLAPVPPKVQLAMRLIASAAGLTDDAEVIALLDTSRWSLAYTLNILERGRALMYQAFDGRGARGGYLRLSDRWYDVVRNRLEAHPRGHMGIADILGTVLAMIDAATDDADSGPGATCQGCPGCTGASCGRSSGPAGTARDGVPPWTPPPPPRRFGPFVELYSAGYLGAPVASAPGRVDVGIDAEQLAAVVFDGEHLASVRVPAACLDLATAKLTVRRFGGFVGDAHLSVDGFADGQAFTLHVQPATLAYGLAMRQREGAPSGRSAAPPSSPLDGERPVFLSGLELDHDPARQHLVLRYAYAPVVDEVIRLPAAAPTEPAAPVNPGEPAPTPSGPAAPSGDPDPATPSARGLVGGPGAPKGPGGPGSRDVG